jgi:hypothetical protein
MLTVTESVAPKTGSFLFLFSEYHPIPSEEN